MYQEVKRFCQGFLCKTNAVLKIYFIFFHPVQYFQPFIHHVQYFLSSEFLQ